MMKNIILTSALVLASAVAGEAMAACPTTTAPNGTWVQLASDDFTGYEFCVTGTGDDWKELHESGGNLYKHGSTGTGAVPTGDNPPALLGTWSWSSPTISYIYTGTPNLNYSWTVYSNTGGGGDGLSYAFCNGTTAEVGFGTRGSATRTHSDAAFGGTNANCN